MRRRLILERHVHELVNFVSIILYLNFSYLAIRGFKQSLVKKKKFSGRFASHRYE